MNFTEIQARFIMKQLSKAHFHTLDVISYVLWIAAVYTGGFVRNFPLFCVTVAVATVVTIYLGYLKPKAKYPVWVRILLFLIAILLIAGALYFRA